MKLLREATRRAKSCVSPRALILAVTALLGLFLPAIASASEADVQLDFNSQNQIYLWISFAFGVIAVIAAIFIGRGVMAMSPGSEKMQEVGKAIKEGALAYLRRQIMTMV